ncbi:cytochrome c biogenesis protein ResB [Sulfuriferula plumbiphila]|nr:cytochrome c biogenesis protein ResB [Sulfuriferula plumbiphila]
MSKSSATFAKSVYELMSSMRFAISLLTVLAIASIIGTVLQQNEPYQNYIIQFGQYWFTVFEWLGLYDVYRTTWFVTILAFLVASTSTCIYRNLPSMLREIRSYREQASENSLRHFQHHAEFTAPAPALEALTQYLTEQGYRYKQRALDNGAGTLLAAKVGSVNRLGYIFTHAAIVIICLGALLDSNIPLKIEQAFGLKRIETRDIPESQVPAASRLAPDSLSFRGNVTIPEGSSADVVFLNIADGYMVQDLPFTIALKKFHIEHYSTGQPKSFASDIAILDKATGKPLLQHTITVNHPLIYDGIAIFQASFGDGGTRLKMNGWNLFNPGSKPFEVNGAVNSNTKISANNQQYTLEFTDFRPFNIENTGATPAPRQQNQDARSLMGGNAVADKTNLHNVGPSFQYKVRDAQGQAREYNNYMLPLLIDKRWYMLSGVRNTPGEPLHYIRFPLDPQRRLGGFMRLRGIMLDPARHAEIARRFAASALQGGKMPVDVRTKLADSTTKVLDLFGKGGYQALSDFIEKHIPAAERDRAAQTYLKILELSTFEAYIMAQQQAGAPAPKADEETGWFIRDSLNSISDIFFYGAPVYLQLAEYDQVNASGLQLTRSPGENIVFGGSALLVMGIFAMFFIRERRLWLLVKPGHVLFAMSSNRKTLDFEKEFERHKQRISEIVKD